MILLSLYSIIYATIITATFLSFFKKFECFTKFFQNIAKSAVEMGIKTKIRDISVSWLPEGENNWCFHDRIVM